MRRGVRTLRIDRFEREFNAPDGRIDDEDRAGSVTSIEEHDPFRGCPGAGLEIEPSVDPQLLDVLRDAARMRPPADSRVRVRVDVLKDGVLWVGRHLADRNRARIAELVILPGVGHFAIDDAPAECAPAIAEFLARVLQRA